MSTFLGYTPISYLYYVYLSISIRIYPDPDSKTKSFFVEQININEHFVKQAGPTSELKENRASLKLLLLLMRSYDLCDEKFHNNDDKKMQKTKNQSVQTDPRPKLVTCKHPILSNINLTLLFQPSEKPNEFPKSTSIQSVFNFNSTLLLQSRKILSNITNNCNSYDHQTQLNFIEQRINYFLEERSFISRQARNTPPPSPGVNEGSLQTGSLRADGWVRRRYRSLARVATKKRLPLSQYSALTLQAELCRQKWNHVKTKQ